MRALAPRLVGIVSLAMSLAGTLLLCRAVFDWIDYGRFVASLLFR